MAFELEEKCLCTAAKRVVEGAGFCGTDTDDSLKTRRRPAADIRGKRRDKYCANGNGII
jgi:hypothetical protein